MAAIDDDDFDALLRAALREPTPSGVPEAARLDEVRAVVEAVADAPLDELVVGEDADDVDASREDGPVRLDPHASEGPETTPAAEIRIDDHPRGETNHDQPPLDEIGSEMGLVGDRGEFETFDDGIVSEVLDPVEDLDEVEDSDHGAAFDDVDDLDGGDDPLDP